MAHSKLSTIKAHNFKIFVEQICSVTKIQIYNFQGQIVCTLHNNKFISAVHLSLCAIAYLKPNRLTSN